MAGIRNRSGRKPISPEGPRSKRVPVLLTPGEFAQIRASAARAGLTVSQYLAQAGLRLTGANIAPIPDGCDAAGALA